MPGISGFSGNSAFNNNNNNGNAGARGPRNSRWYDNKEFVYSEKIGDYVNWMNVGGRVFPQKLSDVMKTPKALPNPANRKNAQGVVQKTKTSREEKVKERDYGVDSIFRDNKGKRKSYVFKTLDNRTIQGKDKRNTYALNALVNRCRSAKKKFMDSGIDIDEKMLANVGLYPLETLEESKYPTPLVFTTINALIGEETHDNGPRVIRKKMCDEFLKMMQGNNPVKDRCFAVIREALGNASRDIEVDRALKDVNSDKLELACNPFFKEEAMDGNIVSVVQKIYSGDPNAMAYLICKITGNPDQRVKVAERLSRSDRYGTSRVRSRIVDGVKRKLQQSGESTSNAEKIADLVVACVQDIRATQLQYDEKINDTCSTWNAYVDNRGGYQLAGEENFVFIARRALQERMDAMKGAKDIIKKYTDFTDDLVDTETDDYRSKGYGKLVNDIMWGMRGSDVSDSPIASQFVGMVDGLTQSAIQEIARSLTNLPGVEEGDLEFLWEDYDYKASRKELYYQFDRIDTMLSKIGDRDDAERIIKEHVNSYINKYFYGLHNLRQLNDSEDEDQRNNIDFKHRLNELKRIKELRKEEYIPDNYLSIADSYQAKVERCRRMLLMNTDSTALDVYDAIEENLSDSQERRDLFELCVKEKDEWPMKYDEVAENRLRFINRLVLQLKGKDDNGGIEDSIGSACKNVISKIDENLKERGVEGVGSSNIVAHLLLEHGYTQFRRMADGDVDKEVALVLADLEKGKELKSIDDIGVVASIAKTMLREQAKNKEDEIREEVLGTADLTTISVEEYLDKEAEVEEKMKPYYKGIERSPFKESKNKWVEIADTYFSMRRKNVNNPVSDNDDVRYRIIDKWVKNLEEYLEFNIEDQLSEADLYEDEDYYEDDKMSMIYSYWTNDRMKEHFKTFLQYASAYGDSDSAGACLREVLEDQDEFFEVQFEIQEKEKLNDDWQYHLSEYIDREYGGPGAVREQYEETWRSDNEAYEDWRRS